MKTTKSSVSVNKSQLMSAAHVMFRKGDFKTFGEALKQAWKAYKIKARMAVDVVEFTFKKANGEIRKAVGTLAKFMFTYENKGTTRKSSPSCIVYWDLEKNAFRSFTVGSLM